MILVLVIVTAMVQARVTTVEIPVIRDIVCCKVDPALPPYQRKAVLFRAKMLHFEFVKGEAWGKGLRSPHPKPPPHQGNSHAAFGGRSWRRQPMPELEYDTLLQSTQKGP